ncbi:hypothetical protein GCM10010435_41690 [Winogradskya consettensis]|uniref:Uncharacterized protein n=1 Tax=Winogradskya consettensis TaxID=113560 RepID=A0A919SQQ6_9ACTN|nr:hypothetical protein Aco04nite_52190 [Actinoplanes consettensis]
MPSKQPCRPVTGTSTPPPRTANEREVGEVIAKSGLDRSEVFIETKIWISDYGYDSTASRTVLTCHTP